MRSRLSNGVGALAVGTFAILISVWPTSASMDRHRHHPWAGCTSASMYYPWAGQFPFDRPGMVNPDVISGPLLSTSMHWAALGDYGFYDSSFGPSRHLRYALGRCPGWERG